MIIIGVFYYAWVFYLAKKNGKESRKIYTTVSVIGAVIAAACAYCYHYQRCLNP